MDLFLKIALRASERDVFYVFATRMAKSVLDRQRRRDDRRSKVV
jgi:hypothetical protein